MTEIYYTDDINTFNGTIPKLKQLETEVINSNITANIQYIVLQGNAVNIVFDDGLAPSDQTTLTGIVQTHVPTPDRINHFNIFPETRKLKGTKYKVAATFHYPGSDSIGDINYIDAISCMANGLTSYDIQIIDRDNNTIIAEKTLTNTNMQSCNLGTISNVPTDSSVMKATGNGNKKVNIQELQVWYGQ